MNETLTKMAAQLEESWNKTDTALKAEYEKYCDENEGKKFDIGYGYLVSASAKFLHSRNRHERDVCIYGRSWYEEENKKAATKFVENLEARVASITGTITDWTISETSQSLSSYLVKGEKGTAKVSQIYAGGYNIVRLHIRNIVKAL